MRPQQFVDIVVVLVISLPRGSIFAHTMAVMRNDVSRGWGVTHRIGSVPYAATQDSKISEAISRLYDAQ